MKTPLCGLVLLPLLGCAASPHYEAYGGEGLTTKESAPSGAYRRQRVIDFSDDTIDGDLATPDGQYIANKKRVAEAAPPAEAPVASDAPAVEPTSPPGKRLVIYTGDYTVMTASVDKAASELIAIAESFGGYLQARSNGVVTVRVPAERFFELIARIPSFGLVTQESMQASDVTKQFFDLQLRIETAEKSRGRLLDLLAQATRMEDILRIEQELRRLTEELETMKGELRFLSDQVSLSTLTVRFYANAPQPSPIARRTKSRFPWINAVGIERVLNDF